jgi:hypothetical protein
MKRRNLVIALMCAVAPAYGVQELTLREQPPLQPLHWCKYSDGHVAPQTEPCGSDTTEVSGVVERKPDGTRTYLPLDQNQAADTTTGNAPASESTSSNDQNAAVKESPLGDFWKRMGKWLAFAIAIGLLGKLLLKQSLVLWTIVGFVLRMILVAVNVMAF